MILPTVHRNGTSREELVELRRATCTALRQATEALSAMAPNARDYYVAGPGAMTAAVEQHERRIVALMDLYDSIMAEGIALMDGE